MSESKRSSWTSGLAINLFSNLISLAVGVGVTYLQHSGSLWVTPLLMGALAWLVTFCSILAIRFSRNVPSKPNPITVDNVQKRIRDWLDKYNITVKSMTDPSCHFIFILTTDGGKKVTIMRTKDHFSDYILVKGLITAGKEEKEFLDSLSSSEKEAAILAMNLELSRAVMGFKTDKGILDEITIFKRVPISKSLNEEEIIELVWQIEAMVGTLYTVGAIAVHRHQMREQEL